MNNELTISKANSFVEASYQMTLDEMRILSLTLGFFDPINPKKQFDFTVLEFCHHFPDVDVKSAYAQVQNAIRKISKRWITLVDNEQELTEVPLVNKRTYFKKEGRFHIEFHEDLMPYIANLKSRYTKYELVNIGAFTSTHTYQQIKDFKKRVLIPAIEEINAKSDLMVSSEPIKQGRTITAFKFTILIKKKTTDAKLERPKFPHKSKYGKFVKLDRQSPKMSLVEYGNYARDCLKILEGYYEKIEDVTKEDLLHYWIFLAVNQSNRSKLGNKQTFIDELKRRGYKIVDCELVKVKKEKSQQITGFCEIAAT